MRKIWFKKTLAWLLTFIMLVVMLPMGVLAEDEPQIPFNITMEDQPANEETKPETQSDLQPEINSDIKSDITLNAECDTQSIAEGINKIKVYVTISLEGELQLSKDGVTGMVRVPVELPEGATAFDALVEAHKQHQENGENGYTASSSKYFLKFWGKESSNIGYFTNGMMVLNTDDSLSDGDYVEGTLYKDWNSDIYARFEQETFTVAAGQALPLTLFSNVITTADWKGGMMNGGVANLPLEGATLLTDDGTACNIPWDDSQNWVTNADGKAIISFEKAGTYYISAKKDGNSIIPPICKVIVTAPVSDEEKDQIVSEDKESLTFEHIKGNNNSIDEIEKSLMLPTTGVSGKTTLSWSSDHDSVIKNDGTVIRPVGQDQIVRVTAKVAYGNISDTKTFDITVKAYTSAEVENALNEVIATLPNKLTPKEWEGDHKKDTNIISLLSKEVAKINSAITVAEDCIPGEQTQVAVNGDITYGSSRVRNKEVVFTLCLGNVSKQYKSSVTVNAKATTKIEALGGEWLTFDTIKKSNTTNNTIISDLSLPKEDNKSYYTEIEWTSSNTNIISIGDYTSNGVYTAKVTRPKLGEKNAVVKLTAKIKPGAYWSYGMAPEGPMPNPAYGEKTFDLIVSPVTEIEQATAQNLVNDGIKLFNLDHITSRGTKEKADLQALTYSFNDVPYNWNYVNKVEGFKEDYRVIDVNWTSENPGIGEVSIGAEVTRKPTEQTGDIVLTLSYNGVTKEKRFPAKVKAFTNLDVANENNILKSVSDALTFDVIKNKNINIKNITDHLMKNVSAIKSDSGVVFEKSNKYHHIGANIAWTSNNTKVISNDLRVTRPEKSTQVTLTATLTSPRFGKYNGVTPIEKTFEVTVLGTGEQPQEESIQTQINEVKEKIAVNYAAKDAAWWSTSGTWWHAVGINAYRNSGDTTKEVSAEAKQAFANKSISEITTLGTGTSTNANKLANTINGMSAFGYDSTSLWTVNKTKIDAVSQLKNIKIEDAKKGWYATIAPYVLLSLNQGEYNADAQENEQIDYLLGELKNADWSFGVDTPAMILQGLTPYYERALVKSEVDKILIALSEKQDENGSYGSANSDASVIIALAQLGINPDKDSRFVKNDKSLIDGLLSYKLSTNDGFWFSHANAYNELATQQGFLGLIAADKVMEDGKPYNVYDFSTIPKIAVYANGIGSEGTKPSEPKSQQDIKVEFTLKSASGTWISQTTVAVKSDATVYHAFTKVLDEKGYTYVGANHNYVSSITNPSGIILAEFSKGKNSGWMYQVNGKMPSIGLTKYNLSDGDNIVWYYTTDWTKDPDAVVAAGGSSSIEAVSEVVKENAMEKVEVEASTDKNGKATALVASKDISDSIIAVTKNSAKVGDKSKKEVNILIKADRKATAIETIMPKDSMVELNNKVDIVTIQTPFASISLNKKNLADLTKDIRGDVKLTIQKVALPQNENISVDKRAEMKEMIGNRPILDFHLSVGDKKISNFAEKVQVTVPYTSSESENENGLVIYYLNDKGALEMMRDCIYDSNARMMRFSTNHFSTYAIGYRNIKFDDIAQHWAKDEIIYLAARDVVNGLTSTEFAPDNNITRAEFTQILANLSGADFSKYADAKFNDVKKDSWFANAVAWAAEKGLVVGTDCKDGTKNFNPIDCITRQDMAVMLSRYMSKVEEKKLSEVEHEVKFTDEDEIESYAESAVRELQKAGVINGKTTDSFAPKENATRAECIKMISVLIKDYLSD